MYNVAYVPIDKRWEKNEMFNLDSKSNDNSIFMRYAVLRDYLRERDINLNTFDTYKYTSEINVWIVADPFKGIKRTALSVFKNRFIPRRSVLLMIEPPVVDFWGWFLLPFYRFLFGATLTWNTKLAKKKKCFHYFLPPVLDEKKNEEYRKSEKKSLAVSIHSNKSSKIPGELYSFRRKIVEYFEEKNDGNFELFGWGWSRGAYPNVYKETTDDKLKTISEHLFNFCIDNSLEYGYITYDLFLSIAVGTVPVYLPMRDTSEYVPLDVY